MGEVVILPFSKVYKNIYIYIIFSQRGQALYCTSFSREGFS